MDEMHFLFSVSSSSVATHTFFIKTFYHTLFLLSSSLLDWLRFSYIRLMASGISARGGNLNKHLIIDVWSNNLAQEMVRISVLCRKYRFIAMDTEFPGVIATPLINTLHTKRIWNTNYRPGGSRLRNSTTFPWSSRETRSKSERRQLCRKYNYDTVRYNVEMLKLLQLGLSIFNEKGENPTYREYIDALSESSRTSQGTERNVSETEKLVLGGGKTIAAWQFNFRFDKKSEPQAELSTLMLSEAGLQFDKMASSDGISTEEFAAYFHMSGLLQRGQIVWIVFHGCYDLGYLLRMIQNSILLPDTCSQFLSLVRHHLTLVVDLKHLSRSIHGLVGGGLQHLAGHLSVIRCGTQHQAGSDSHLTGRVFFRILQLYYENHIPRSYNNKIHGLNVGVASLFLMSATMTGDVFWQVRDGTTVESTKLPSPVSLASTEELDQTRSRSQQSVESNCIDKTSNETENVRKDYHDKADQVSGDCKSSGLQGNITDSIGSVLGQLFGVHKQNTSELMQSENHTGDKGTNNGEGEEVVAT